MLRMRNPMGVSYVGIDPCIVCRRIYGVCRVILPVLHNIVDNPRPLSSNVRRGNSLSSVCGLFVSASYPNTYPTWPAMYVLVYIRNPTSPGLSASYSLQRFLIPQFRVYLRPDVLVIDEVGYMQSDMSHFPPAFRSK